MRRRGTLAPALAALLLAPSAADEAGAWPAPMIQSLTRDARRLLPGSLAILIAKHEREILEEAARFPPELGQALLTDLGQGRLQESTVATLEQKAAEPLDLLREQRVSEGTVRLGALLRIPADLADPVLSVGAAGYPAGVTREYYAFVEANLSKIPVVRGDPRDLTLKPGDLPAYWQSVLDRSRPHSPVIGSELFVKGRLVDHRTVDYRSPVYGVASLAYSRAVNAIAATWLAVWRAARGDLTRQPSPTVVAPTDHGPPPPDGGRP